MLADPGAGPRNLSIELLGILALLRAAAGPRLRFGSNASRGCRPARGRGRSVPLSERVSERAGYP